MGSVDLDVAAANFSSFELADHRWLVESGRALLREFASADTNSPKVLTQLRKLVGPARAALVAGQIELRRRARRKFQSADQMYFTPLGLEQSTSENLARLKAARFRAAANIRDAKEITPTATWFDLCCGVGGDAIGLAAEFGRTTSRQAELASTDQSTGALVAMDGDPVATVYAAANLAALAGNVRTETRCEMLAERPHPEIRSSLVHIDPDRRTSGRRSTRLDDFSPGTAYLNALVGNASAAIKLAPATEVPAEWTSAESSGDRPLVVEWLGEARECKQLVVWTGSLATASIAIGSDVPGGTYQATALTNIGWETFAGSQLPLPSLAPEVGRYLLEPHATLLAGKLVGDLCKVFHCRSLTPAGGYLTTDVPTTAPLTDTFEVIAKPKAKLPEVERVVRSLDAGTVEVKKRGVRIDPNAWQKRLTGEGANRLAVFVYASGKRESAVVARRLPR